jgi:hypothetical protein
VDEKNSSLFCGNFSIINRPMTLDEAIGNAGKLLEDAAAELISFYLGINKAQSGLRGRL